MGWRWTKVFRRGPVRVSVSKSGFGGSFGIPGCRVGVSATGRRYISLGIPGTGLYWTHYFGKETGEISPNDVKTDPTP